MVMVNVMVMVVVDGVGLDYLKYTSTVSEKLKLHCLHRLD